MLGVTGDTVYRYVYISDTLNVSRVSTECDWYTLRSVACSVQRTAYSVQRTAYSVECTVTAYSVQRAAYSVQRTAYSVQHTVYSDSVQRAAYSIQCTVTAYSVQRTAYSDSVQRAAYSVQRTAYSPDGHHPKVGDSEGTSVKLLRHQLVVLRLSRQLPDLEREEGEEEERERGSKRVRE